MVDDQRVILERLELAGFRGIRQRLAIDLPSSFLVVTGRNGSGKSTICDAIEFSLTRQISKYGEGTEKGEGIGNYVWWVGDPPPAERFVRLTLRAGQARVVITQEPGGTHVEGLQGLDGLESFLCGEGAPADALAQLCRTGIIRDEMIAAHSLDLAERERYLAVRSSLGSDVLGPFQKGCSEVEAELKDRLNRHQREYDAARHEIGILRSQLSEIQAALKDEEAVEDALDVLRRTVDMPVNDVRLDLGGIREAATHWLEAERLELARFAGLMREAESSEQEMRELPDLEEREAEWKATVTRTEEAYSTAEQALRTAQRGLSELEPSRDADRSAAFLLEHGQRLGLSAGRCPLCRQSQSRQQFEEALRQLAQHVTERELLRARFDQAVTDYTERLKRANREAENARVAYEETRARIHEIHDRARGVRANLAELGYGADGAADLRQIDEVYDARRGRVEEVQEALHLLGASQALGRADKLRESIHALERESARSEDGLRRVEGARSRLRELRKGVRRAVGEVVQDRLASLAPLLSDLYRRLRPHADWAEVSYHLRGDVRRFLSLEVGDGLNPRFIFSSGQRRALGLAFLVALYSSRTWARMDALILDDPVQHIDDYRSLHISEMLTAIRKTGRQLICTVEDEALARLLCRRLKSEPHSPGLMVTLAYPAKRGVEVRDQRIIEPLREELLVSA
jgi:chromosome segregation protein